MEQSTDAQKMKDLRCFAHPCPPGPRPSAFQHPFWRSRTRNTLCWDTRFVKQREQLPNVRDGETGLQSIHPARSRSQFLPQPTIPSLRVPVALRCVGLLSSGYVFFALIAHKFIITYPCLTPARIQPTCAWRGAEGSRSVPQRSSLDRSQSLRCCTYILSRILWP